MKFHARRRNSVETKELNTMNLSLTRSLEFVAVIISLFWAVEARADGGRSLSSLGIPSKKETTNLEFLQYSPLTNVAVIKVQPRPVTLMEENPSLTFRQSPFYAPTQFTLFRLPSFSKNQESH